MSDAGAALPIDTDADVRARDVEAQMTDEERFSLLVSVMGANDLRLRGAGGGVCGSAVADY